MAQAESFISDEEIGMIIAAFQRSGVPFTKADVVMAAQKIGSLRIETVLWLGALDGRLALLVKNGEVCLTKNAEALPAQTLHE